MAVSPETAAPPETADMHPSPPPSSSLVPRFTQESPSLTSAAPPEMAHLDHAAPTPPPPPEHYTAEYSESGESPPQPPDGADPPPSFPSPEAAPAASSALEAASPEKAASPSPCPPEAPVEVSPDVTASAASPPRSPQIGEASSVVDAPPPLSPPPTPPATTSRASPDSSTTQAVVMASQQASPPTPAPESGSHTAPAPAPAPLTPPLESGSEGLSLQQQPRPLTPEMALPVCENSEPAQPPPPPPLPPAESTYALPDAAADEAVVAASEVAAGSPPELEATDGETDTGPGVPPALESGAEGVLPPPRPEMSPPRCENSEAAQPLPPPVERIHGSLEAVANEVAAVASEEAAGSPPALETTGGEGALESWAEGPVQTSSSPKMEAEPCSPEMAPPGFENFKSKWLTPPPPTPLAESTHSLVETSATSVARSLPALEAMDVEMDISPGLLPSLKSAEEGPLQQPLQESSSLTMEAAPCSPDMPPPGFENFKPSWLPQPTLPPPAGITFVEKACSVPALEATDVETETAGNLLLTLESGAGGSLQVPLPRSSSAEMQVAPCSLYMGPPGFENLKLQQLQLPSPLVQTSCTLQDSAATDVVYVTSEEARQPSPALDAMDVEMDNAPALPTTSESGAGESLRQEPSRLPSHTAPGTACSLEIVPSGSENLYSSQLLSPPAIFPLVQTPDTLADADITTVTVEEVCHPLSVAEATDEAKGSILPPPLGNGCEGPLPCLEPKVSSPVVQAAPGSPEIVPMGFDSLEPSQQTSHLAERIDSSSHVPATKSATVKSEKFAQPVSPLQVTDTDMEGATLLESPSKSEERSLPQPQHQPSTPSVKDEPCSPDIAPPGYENLDSLEQPPPPLCSKFAHQVGKVYCGQCETLLMYPFGAPAVRCSTCLFITEIEERNVRPRISMEQSVSPHP